MGNLLTYSSITKKLFVGIAGLFLALFLLVHLTINLFLMAGDNGEMFMKMAGFMSTNLVIKVFEIVLFAGFLIHIVVALVVTFKNWKSRPVRYYTANKSTTSFFSKYMFHTGVIIFVFLLLHFINFYFVKLGWVNPPAGIEKHDFYTMAIQLFGNKIYSLIYIAFFVFLGFHLNHAFQSGFQTLGLNHNKYNRTIRIISFIYAVVVSGGFCIIPLYFMFIF